MNTHSCLSGFASANLPAPQTARFFRITTQEGQIRLKVGPGDHTWQEWVLDRDQLKSLALDALPILLR